ncbi:MAG: hypothetical protein M3P51_16595, partial [Chloroflexota bacterium]|nr:hypothetical protein [Chloroflexota bacterium]
MTMTNQPVSTAELLQVLDIGPEHFVTTDARYGAVLECSGLNMSIKSAEGADTAAGLVRDLIDFLDPDTHLQLVLEAGQIHPEQWVEGYQAQFHPPPGLESYVARTGEWLRGELEGHSVTRLRYYTVVTIPGPPKPKLPRSFRRKLRGERSLVYEREEHSKVLIHLANVVSETSHALTALELAVTRLGERELTELLWRHANPSWSRDVAAPLDAASPEDCRCLRDRLSQSRMAVRRDHIKLDGVYEATIALRALPSVTYSGWFAKLAASGLTFRAALHIDSLDTNRERAALEGAHIRRHNVLTEREEKGKSTDFRTRAALAEIGSVIEGITTGDTRTFKTAIFVTLRAPSRDALDTAVREAGKALRDVGGTAIDRCYLGQVKAWQTTLPLGVNPIGMTYRTTSLNLSHCFPFLHHKAGTPAGPVLGFSEPGHEVVQLDLRDPSLTNGFQTLNGKQGSGKTMVMLRQALDYICMGVRVVALERSANHFAGLVAAVPGAQMHQVGLDGSYRVNPLQLPHGIEKPPQEKIDYLLDLLTLLVGERQGNATYLTGEERGILERACREVYTGCPRPKGPYLRHLHEWLAERREESLKHRELARDLEPYVGEGTYAALLDGPTTVQADAPLVVFNFADVSPRVAQLAMLPLVEHAWSIIADPGHLTLLAMDEGWSILEGEASARFMKVAMRTGRHHGLLTINASQFVSDYDTPVGRVVLDSRSVALLLCQNPAQVRKTAELFELTEDEADILGKLSTVKRKRAGAYLHSKDGADSGCLSIYHTPEQYWLFTSYKPERLLREEALRRHKGDVWAAVQELARTDGKPDWMIGVNIDADDEA